MTGLYDSFNRPISYLRISVTDRCNLRCIYCMPEGGVSLVRHEDILSYEEICTAVRAAAELGIKKVRLTGGEPLVRSRLPQLVRMLSKIDAIDDISLTTNGTLLSRYAAELKSAGLKRVNVSLDTLRPDRFKFITRLGDNLDGVLEGIQIAKTVGLNPVKVNMVVMAGINDDEVAEFAAKTIEEGWHVRFIELMPVSYGSAMSRHFIPASDIKKRFEMLGKLDPVLPIVGNGPARYFRFSDARGTVGFITPISEHFCFRCNRLRLTADGKLLPCLLSQEEVDVKRALRPDVSTGELKDLFEEAVARKPLRHYIAQGSSPPDRPFCRAGG
jgi:GTP 3',8-cyclase